MAEEQDREKIGKYQVLQQKIKVLDNRRNLIFNRLMEVENTLASLEELKEQKDSDVFLPLGSGVYMKGSLKDTDKMIVLIGADVAVDVNFDRAKKVLEDNSKVLENGLKTIEDEIANVAEELVILEADIQKILQRR